MSRAVANSDERLLSITGLLPHLAAAGFPMNYVRLWKLIGRYGIPYVSGGVRNATIRFKPEAVPHTVALIIKAVKHQEAIRQMQRIGVIE